jgi:hypothetical protein
MGRAQVFEHDEMVLNTYLLFLKCLLLLKLKAANHSTLSPPKAAFNNPISLPYCSSQTVNTTQPIYSAFNAYLQKLIFDNFIDKCYFIVIHSFSKHHS